MNYGYPFLTEWTVKLLDEMAEDFQTMISDTRLKKTRLIVTSMTRTEDKLMLLKRRNGNASLNSPHLNGNAFDITYVRFKSTRLFLTSCDKEYLRKALSEVIWQLRKENKCWATFEKDQTVFMWWRGEPENRVSQDIAPLVVPLRFKNKVSTNEKYCFFFNGSINIV